LGNGGLLVEVLETPLGLDSIDMGVFAAIMLKGSSLSVQLAYIKLLPWEERLRFLEDTISDLYQQFASDDILGKVLPDGSRKAGELFHKLSYGTDPVTAEEAFRNVCFSIGQIKLDRKQYHEAIKCFYLSGRISDTLSVLFKAFSSKMFTTLGTVPSELKEQQEEVLKYYHLFDKLIHMGALQVSDVGLWEDIKTSFVIVEALTMARENQLLGAIDHMEKFRLVPYRDSISTWMNTPFSGLVPRLIDAYTFCLYEIYRRGLWPPERRRDVLDKVHRLFEVCNSLGEGPSAPSESTRQYLRDLADICSSA